MSIPNPTAFSPIPTIGMTSGHSINTTTELQLAENINFAQRYVNPPIVCNLFNSDAPGTNPFDHGSLIVNKYHASDNQVFASWRTHVNKDVNQFKIEFYAGHNVATVGGEVYVEFKLSGGASLGSVTIDTSGSPAMTLHTITSGVVSPAHDRDTIELHARCTTNMNAGDAVLCVSTVTITAVPQTITSTPTDYNFLTHDTTELLANKALSVSHRRRQIANLELIRKKRTESLVTFSDDYGLRANYEAYFNDSNEFVTVAQIPFTSGHGQTRLSWSVLGYRKGSSGTIRLSTKYMEAGLGTAAYQDATLASGWTLGASLPASWIDNGGSAALECYERSEDRILVQIKGDGSSRALLMGLCIWFVEA
jgi:hypothetical protein